VYKTFSKKLTHAVTGIGSGPKKLEQCTEMGVVMIDEDGLFELISKGTGPTTTTTAPQKSPKADPPKKKPVPIEPPNPTAAPAIVPPKPIIPIVAKPVTAIPKQATVPKLVVQPPVVEPKIIAPVPIVQKKIDTIICSICGDDFVTENAYGQHIDDAHGVNSAETKQMPPPAKKQQKEEDTVIESPVKAQKQFSRLRKSNPQDSSSIEWGEKRRTKDGVVFYKSFSKGGQKIEIGDFVEIDKENSFFVGKISDMWEDDETMETRCKVYYMPEDTHLGRTKGNYSIYRAVSNL
jgi:uncharacterized C2H2 Zn-finger protein